MKHSRCISIKPCDLNDMQKDEITNLHQKYITLDRETILSHLSNRDKMYMYYHKTTNELIATVGIQFIVYKNNVLIYIGNTVVEDKFKHEGCLAHSIFKAMVYASLRYPFKNKYWCALSSSSGSFSYAQHFQPCWPNPKEATSEYISDLMVHSVEMIGITQYRVIDGNIITYDLCSKINGSFHLNEKKNTSAASVFFNHLNPNAEHGEQLFFISSLKIYKLVNSLIYSLHDRLIKNPAIYHKIKQRKNKNSFSSLLLIVNNLISKKVKWVASLSFAVMIFIQFVDYL